MAISFSHSLRVLEADKSQAGWLGLGVMIVLSGLWLAWGLWGEITLYETTEQAHLSGGTAAVAYFSPAARAHLRPGQPALLHLESYHQYGAVPATVSRVSRKLVEGRLEIRLSLQAPPASLLSLQPDLPGTVEVEIGRISPAALLLRAVGQWTKADKLTTDVQQTQETVQ